jgi:hypothetical protein
MRCPRADFFVLLPIRTRAALGHRSTGTKTGPHGACLTAAACVRRNGQNTRQPKPAGNPVLGLSHRVEPVASAASVSAERLARCKLAARSRAWRGHWLDNAPFGAPLPSFLRVIFSENRNYTFRDHALPEARH